MVTVTERLTPIVSVPRRDYVPTADQRVVLRGLSWSDFETFVAMRGEDAAGPRVTYLEGTLQLMSPSRDHESITRHLAIIIEAYLVHLGVRFKSVGSWLVKDAPADAGLEPDNCYLLDDLTKMRPDLAIEVVWTSGGIDKLEVYRALGIREVWFWENEDLTFYVLRGDGYTELSTSKHVPTFDKQVVRDLLGIDATSELYAELRKRFG